jgi:branched-subunit amino acid ABC-type transport system permease component
VLIAPLTNVLAQMGGNYLARSFFVVIVGGAGSIAGVAAGSGLMALSIRASCLCSPPQLTC